MRFRYAIILFILHQLSALPLLAQGGSDIRQLWWRSDSLIYQTAQDREIPSLLALQQVLLPNSIAFNLSGGTLAPAHQPVIPRSETHWGLKASGGHRRHNISLRGKAQYGRGINKGLSHTLTHNPQLFYPFLVSDTIPKHHTSEHYAFGFQASYQPIDWLSLGVQAGYLGAVRYSRQDPRVHNTISAPYGGLSLTLIPRGLGLLSLSGIYYAYRQQLSFNVLKDSSTEQIYILRPMGRYNYRYSGRESNGSYRYLRPSYRIDLNWLYLPYELQVGVRYQGSKSRLHTTEAGVYYSELNTQEVTPYLQAKLMAWGKHHRLLLGADYSYDQRRGIERTYQSVSVGPNGVMTQQELIAELPSYKETWHKWHGTITYRYHSERYKVLAQIGYGGFALTTNGLRDKDSGAYGVHYAAPKLSFSWLGNSKEALYGSVSITTYHQLQATNRTTLHHEQKTRVIEESIRSYQLGPQHRATIATHLYLPLRDGKVIGLSIQITPSLWPQRQWTLYSSGTLSYQF